MPIGNQFFILLSFFHYLGVTKLGCSDIQRISQKSFCQSNHYVYKEPVAIMGLLFSLTYIFLLFNVAPLSLHPSLTPLFSAAISVLHNSRTRLALAPAACWFQAFFYLSGILYRCIK